MVAEAEVLALALVAAVVAVAVQFRRVGPAGRRPAAAVEAATQMQLKVELGEQAPRQAGVNTVAEVAARI